MANRKKKRGNNTKKEINTLKNAGVKCSRDVLFREGLRFHEENKELLQEAMIETKVLRVKKYYKFKGWNFPPRIADKKLADMINQYYGKHIVNYKTDWTPPPTQEIIKQNFNKQERNEYVEKCNFMKNI